MDKKQNYQSFNNELQKPMTNELLKVELIKDLKRVSSGGDYNYVDNSFILTS